MKCLCIYAYFEKNQEYKDNFQYFLKYGVNTASDYVFVLNGQCTVSIPESESILVIQRENIGFDFGAFAAALKRIDVNQYDYFIFLNTSVRGPFLLYNYTWQNAFIEMITGDVKLVGTTINVHPESIDDLANQGFTPPHKHVQSQMFAMDRECLAFLRPKVFDVDTSEMNFQQVIENKEVAMSQHVLKNKWNINCLLSGYKGIDYRLLQTEVNPTSFHGDPSYVGRYFGGTYTPYDVMFVKTNRHLLIYNYNLLSQCDKERQPEDTRTMPRGR